MKRLKKLLSQDRWILPSLRQQKSGLFWSIFLNFMITFAAGALMFVSGFLISRSAQHPSNILIIYVPIVLTRAFGIARPVFRYAQRLVSHNWVLRVVSKTRKRLYESAASTASSIRGQLQTGEVLSLLADDLDRLQNLYLRTLFPLGSGMVLYLFLTIAIGTINWLFMLWWFVMLAVILVIVPLLSLAVNYKGVQQQKKLQQSLYIDATDAILGLQDWVLSGRQEDLVQNQGETMSRLAHVKNRSMKFGWWRDFVIQVLVLILTITTLMWATNQFSDSSSTVNYIAAFTLAIFPLIDSFIAVNQGVSESSFYEDSIVRLNDLPEPTLLQETRHTTNSAVINFNQVTFKYGDKTIVDNLSFEVQPKEKIALLGRSGAGKTTLLNILGGMDTLTSGKVWLDDNEISSYTQKQLTSYRRYDIGFVFQFYNLVQNLTAVENVSLATQICKTPMDSKEALKQVGLEHRLNNFPSQLSGGEQQRVAIARALAKNPKLLLCDEPTGALDYNTGKAILKLLQDTARQTNMTVIIITHNLAIAPMADRIIHVKNGTVDSVEINKTPLPIDQIEW